MNKLYKKECINDSAFIPLIWPTETDWVFVHCCTYCYNVTLELNVQSISD